MKIYSCISAIKNAFSEYKKFKYLEMLKKNGLQLGRNVTIVDTFFFDPAHCFLISIGDNCTIAPNVRILAHDASTKHYLGYSKIACVTIGADCFLGDSAIIMPGVTIGESTVIGAGSVVTKNIPARSVAVGIPAHVLCSLDDYLKKIEAARGENTVYSEEYRIHNIDSRKRTELRQALTDSIGFIV